MEPERDGKTDVSAMMSGMAAHAKTSAWESGDTVIREIARGLRFPEGPIIRPDGSFLLVEIAARTLTRISPGGEIDRFAMLGGGPNGAAIGPDGAAYVCNNGGLAFAEQDGVTLTVGRPDDYTQGWINRVDVETGEVRVLYDRTDKGPLLSPNDIVFDSTGGFWFTDVGDFNPDNPGGALCYATIDGTSCRKVVGSLRSPNGIGLSPDGKTLYYADTVAAHVVAYDVAGPGQVAEQSLAQGGRVIGQARPGAMLDSLAVLADGRIAVGTLSGPGGLTIFDPAGGEPAFVSLPDTIVTNLCFGGPNLETAYVTLSGTGRLIAMDNLGRGCPLNFA